MNLNNDFMHELGWNRLLQNSNISNYADIQK